MAAIVYHPGLQTHLESQLVESRTLRLRLPSPKHSIDLPIKSCFRDSNMIKTHHHHHEENIHKTETYQTKPNNGGWNFLDALSNMSQNTSKKETTTTTYVHPQQKRSSLILSPKSLELCTENLGNESGTDIVENDMLLSLMGTMEEKKQPCRQVLVATKKVKTQNFPPPLTTIRGSESLRVRPHREDGRLVIEMAKVPPSTSCFQADRSNGRLRLCFLTNQTINSDPEEEEEQEDVDVDVVVDDDMIDENEQPHNEEEICENKMISGEIQDVEEEEETEDKTEEETEEEAEEKELKSVVVACEEMKGSDVRMEKYERVRRCKENGENENKELLNWGETHWMVTTIS